MLHKAVIVLFAAIVYFPITVLFFDGITLAAQKMDLLTLAVPTGRRLTLFLRTIGYAGAVGIGTVLVGIMSGSIIWSYKSKGFISFVKVLFGLSLIMLLVPPYIHALAWSSAIYWIFSKLASAGLGMLQVQGIIVSWWVMLMALIPVGLGFSLVGFRCIDNGLVEGGRVLKNDMTVFHKIILPLALPTAAAGGVFAFLLTVLDYSVPSLFLINIYSLEIFAEFSATNQPVRALLLSLPLMGVAFLVVYYIAAVFPSIAGGLTRAQSKEALPLVFPIWFKLLQLVFLGVIFLQVSVPILSLLIKVGSLESFFLSLKLAGREIIFTIILSTAAASAAIVLAAGVGLKLAGSKGKKIWWALAALPLAVPAPLVGIGMAALYSKPVLNVFYGSLLMPVMAALVRFVPIAAIVLAVQFKRFDSNLLDAARVFQRSPLQGAFRVRLPLLLPGLAAAFIITLVLTAGELGATLIVVPPGYSTLTMRIYNFMHYGSSDLIAGLCLAMLAISMIFSFAAYRIVMGRGSLRRQI
ncbi:ABC transporter permease [Desulfitibacter alkalitolerans]|uniref:ABC transporter permease n=1 Tax=Desulfitibacter alkalitolerans TaxID=264641 RepID=UPI000AEB0840|nr:hypothetical protein [Desulfitibacter alkalitolerans]